MLIYALIKCAPYFYWDKDNSETKQAIDFKFSSYFPLMDAYVLYGQNFEKIFLAPQNSKKQCFHGNIRHFIYFLKLSVQNIQLCIINTWWKFQVNKTEISFKILCPKLICPKNQVFEKIAI